ncbi:hypothetical protein C8J57DRAFT_1293355 [Mycena rebaudengoi]|nr:hypothetical protein C8J57DRAFT_1293355 [Mycena rebaudengoi]
MVKAQALISIKPHPPLALSVLLLLSVMVKIQKSVASSSLGRSNVHRRPKIMDAKKRARLGRQAYKADDILSSWVYVGNLPTSTTQTQLEEYFKNCGVIQHVSIRYSALEQGSWDPGHYATIKFAGYADAQKACRLHGSEFCGRLIYLRATRAQKSKKGELPLPSPMKDDRNSQLRSSLPRTVTTVYRPQSLLTNLSFPTTIA